MCIRDRKESYTAGSRWAARGMGGDSGEGAGGDGNDGGSDAGPGGGGNPGGDGPGSPPDGKPPRWARSMKWRNAATHAAEAAHIIRSADGGGGSSSIDLSEKE